MITLEQIRLLEKQDHSSYRAHPGPRRRKTRTLRKGLESAQKRMKELETLVDGFKTDQTGDRVRHRPHPPAPG